MISAKRYNKVMDSMIQLSVICALSLLLIACSAREDISMTQSAITATNEFHHHLEAAEFENLKRGPLWNGARHPSTKSGPN
jgi:hypothetical protein